MTFLMRMFNASGVGNSVQGVKDFLKTIDKKQTLNRIVL